jgi:hypothetical protein
MRDVYKPKFQITALRWTKTKNIMDTVARFDPTIFCFGGGCDDRAVIDFLLIITVVE